MDKVLQFFKNYLGASGVFLLILGFFFSSGIQSFAVLLIVLQPLIEDDRKFLWEKIRKNKLLLSFWMLFAMVLAGVFYSSGLKESLKEIVIKLPLVLIPFGLLSEKTINKKLIWYYLVWLSFLTFSVGLASFINYMVHKTEIDRMILHSKAIPIITGINHIYFSIIVAFATLSGFLSGVNNHEQRRFRIFFGIFTVANLIFLHVIAARTGMLAFYVSVLFIVIWWGAISKRFFASIGLMVIMTIVIVLSVRNVESLHNRFLKTVEDIDTYQNNGNINYQSVSMRLEFWEKSFKVFLTSPVYGVGLSDVRSEMNNIFTKENSVLSEKNRMGPHNQYLEFMAGCGLIGFIAFLLILIFPLASILRDQKLYSMAFLMIILVSFFVESVMERQTGVMFFTLFWCLLNYEGKKEEINDTQEIS